jgi:hypothetical protein
MLATETQVPTDFFFDESLVLPETAKLIHGESCSSHALIF